RCSREVQRQRGLDDENATVADVSARPRVIPDDDKPLYLPRLPQLQLGRQIPVLIETRRAYTAQMTIIRLPFDRVARETFLVVVKGEHVLKDSDLNCFPSQVSFAVEQKVSEPCVARFVQPARFTEAREGLVDHFRLWLDPFDPAEHSRRTVRAIVTFFV